VGAIEKLDRLRSTMAVNVLIYHYVMHHISGVLRGGFGLFKSPLKFQSF